jgi:excinuclease ABC subunit B
MVIMYADKITDSMRLTIDETERRRSLQLAYNEQHGITPQAIVKARQAIIGIEDEDDVPAAPHSKHGKEHKHQPAAKMPYIEEYTSHVNIAADPVIPYMNKNELQRAITQLRSEMVEAAKRMEFMEAARMRDELLKMEEHLNTLN